MSFVKTYNAGEIKVDPFGIRTLNEAPFIQYTHELPLLSFADIHSNVNLSLVFNYERYREEKVSGYTPYCISPVSGGKFCADSDVSWRPVWL